jgi:hypothetical protein
VGWNNDLEDAGLSKRVASNLLDSFPHSNVIFLERANILAQFASLAGAQDTVGRCKLKPVKARDVPRLMFRRLMCRGIHVQRIKCSAGQFPRIKYSAGRCSADSMFACQCTADVESV